VTASANFIAYALAQVAGLGEVRSQRMFRGADLHCGFGRLETGTAY
jgi:hypothetical protein